MSTLFRKKCQCIGVVGQKSKNISTQFLNDPLTWLFHNNAMPELLRSGGSHKNELEYSVEQIINPIPALSWVYTWYLDKSYMYCYEMCMRNDDTLKNNYVPRLGS